MTISINGSSGLSNTQNSRNDPNVNLNRISSGQRINSAADDAAGLAISNRMATQLGGLTTSIRNASDGVSLVQVESGALSSITQNLQRIRELSLQSGNGALNDTDRQALQEEANQLLEATNSILETSNFNGVQLLNDDSTQQFQVGPNVSDTLSLEGKDIQEALETEGLFDINLSTQNGASSALDVLDSSLGVISERNSELGAVANQFDTIIDSLQETRINTAEAKSRISDSDIAKETSELSAKLIQNQAQIAVQVQANGNRGLILQLLS
jgi:flagellin